MSYSDSQGYIFEKYYDRGGKNGCLGRKEKMKAQGKTKKKRKGKKEKIINNGDKMP